MSEYNGWTNYETWTVKLVIDNTESLYYFFQDAVKEVQEKYSEDQRISSLINILENVIKSDMPQTTNRIWGPIMNAAYHRINFPEIARSMLEDAKEEYMS